MKEIKLTKGYVALVDDEDYRELNKYNWRIFLTRAGSPAAAGRDSKTVENAGRKTILMHRQILGLGAYTKPHIDHINRNPLDNQKCNLRIVTHQQNIFNKSKQHNTTSIYKGVSFDKDRDKWFACIAINGKTISLGRFIKEKSAALAYNTKAKELFGDYACLNKID